MKKLFLLVGCISLILLSCHKNQHPDLISNQKREPVSPGSKEVSFKITDIYSTLSSIKRRIDVISQRTNTVLGKMFITLSCNDPKDDLHKKINYEPDKFSGQITLESSHLIEFTKKILNGKLVKTESLMLKDLEPTSAPSSGSGSDPDPVLNRDQDLENSDPICSMFSIAECAKDAVDKMYWLDYAFCTLQSNFCLMKKFGICAGQICK